MTTYWDLTDKERAALTDEQLAHYLDVERMQKGAVRPMLPVLETVEEVVVPTRTYYAPRIGYARADFVFTTASDAADALDMAAGHLESAYPAKYNVLRTDRETEIVEVQATTVEDHARFGALAKEMAARQDRNTKAVAEYEKAVAAYAAFADDITEDRSRVLELARSYETIRRVFADYLKTAQGDEETARRFLARVYTAEEIATAFEWVEDSCNSAT